MITLDTIRDTLKDKEPSLQHVLQYLEDEIVKGRNKYGVPVYLTKYRIKSATSTYLKLKRKVSSDMWSLHDIAGLRVLCLFDNDLDSVYDYLLQRVFSDLDITEIKFFNIANDKIIQLRSRSYLTHYFRKGLSADKLTAASKASGYSSIHFIVYPKLGGVAYPVEVQLRTLLQDVWGELEHNLSYKTAHVNTEIRNVFRRLQRDITSMGKRLSELDDISKRDATLEQFLVQAVPAHYMHYDENLFPSIFNTDASLRERLKDYEEVAVKQKSSLESTAYAGACRNKYDAIINSSTSEGRPLAELLWDEKLWYWEHMEDAYIAFCEGRLDEAIRLYSIVIERKIRYAYVPHARLGEIYFFKRDNVRALSEFDKAESILSERLGTTPHSVRTMVNDYRIKVRSAHICWMCGPEYLDICLAIIAKAEEAFANIKRTSKSNEDDPFNEQDLYAMLNNCCWYRLEKFWYAYNAYKGEQKRQRAGGTSAAGSQPEPGWSEVSTLYEHANKAFVDLEAVLDREDISSNALDTAAWFCLCSFKLTLKQDYLEKAVRYTRRMLKKTSRAALVPLVVQVQSEHLKEIATQATRLGLWRFGEG